MTRPKLSAGEWKTLHQIGATIAKAQRAKGRSEQMDQGEFLHQVYRTAHANPRLFPRGIPPGLEAFKKRDDGLIAMIERPDKRGPEDEK